MAFLHPDKLIGVARAVQQRPRRPKPSAEKSAVRAASGNASRPLSPSGGAGGDDKGDLMANLAYRMRDEHWNGYLDRMARGGVADPKGKPAQTQQKPKQSAAPSITISLAPNSNG